MSTTAEPAAGVEEVHVPLARILFDTTTQVRATIDNDVVSTYAEEMAAGARFPAVDLFVVDDKFLIGDGCRLGNRWDRHRIAESQREQAGL